MSNTTIKDTFISKNDKTITRLSSPCQDKLDIIDALWGSIPDTITLEESKKERLRKV